MSTEVIEETEVIDEVAEAKDFNLIFLNDDTTTFEFVIFLLVSLIGKTSEEALDITHSIHKKGSAVVKTGSENELTSIQREINLYALEEGFNFKTSVEPQ